MKFYYFVKLKRVLPIIGLLRNKLTFYIKWIFDSLFVRVKMALFTWALPALLCKILGKLFTTQNLVLTNAYQVQYYSYYFIFCRSLCSRLHNSEKGKEKLLKFQGVLDFILFIWPPYHKLILNVPDNKSSRPNEELFFKTGLTIFHCLCLSFCQPR